MLRSLMIHVCFQAYDAYAMVPWQPSRPTTPHDFTLLFTPNTLCGRLWHSSNMLLATCGASPVGL